MSDSIFGGGKNPMKDAEPYLQQGLQQYQQYMNPYLQTGQNALNNYFGGVNEMQNPQAFIEKMMSGYMQSPEAQQRIKQGTDSILASDAASGMLGSGAEKKALAGYTQQQVGADQQNWLNNMMDAYRGYLSGMGNLAQMGQQGAEQAGDTAQSMYNSLAEMAYGKDEADNKGKNSILSDVFHGAGAIGGGLVAGIPGAIVGGKYL